MAKAVEDKLMQMLGEAKGGSAGVEGMKELKLLKERNVSADVIEVESWLKMLPAAPSPGRLVIEGPAMDPSNRGDNGDFIASFSIGSHSYGTQQL